MRRFRIVVFLLLFVLSISIPVLATEPTVAIHVSEATQALESKTASTSTPSGPGTTGKEWWTPWWHYLVMPESVKEALQSDGTPFVVVTDADILDGELLTDGKPRFPIVISLASEAIFDDEIAPLRDYVSAGGFLLVGSSAFTRHPTGTKRGDFALAAEMGLHSASTSLQNWQENSVFSKQSAHRLVSHIPSGSLTWRMPLTAEDISVGISPTHTKPSTHHAWQVTAGDATVIASSDIGPYLTVKSYGKGYFIYHAAMQPLIGNGGFAPGMYAYGIFRNAIEWAFEAFDLPIVKLSPWPYGYNAAYLCRHDFENYQSKIANIAASAQFENSLGAKGDYYICTGTLREEMGNSSTAVAGLRQAVSSYGATIGSHNGGLKNPRNSNLTLSSYDYWHWGPDEALDVQPAGYASGKAYASASISSSLDDIDTWLAGLVTNKRTWVAPYFNATREDSFEILEELGIVAAGEQKLSPFPHWTVSLTGSTLANGWRFNFVSLPVSDWYIGSDIAQSMESGHTSATIHALVDYYYGLGALINLYMHNLSTTQNPSDYIRYCAAKSAIWPANASSVYEWWTNRSTVEVVPSYTTIGDRRVVRAAITGATDPNTAIEFFIPNWSIVSSDLQVTLNGATADPSSYRAYKQGIKVKVGRTVSVVEISYPHSGSDPAVVPSSLSLSPTSVQGGRSSSGTVTLSGKAPAGGAVVTLKSSNTAAAQVPASVKVAAGTTRATFTVTSSEVAVITEALITASYKGTNRTATLVVLTHLDTLLYADYGSSGTWMYDGSTWTKLTPADPQSMVASDSHLYAD